MESSTVAQVVPVWVGTGGNNGIYRIDIDTSNGSMESTQVVVSSGAGFLALHPTQRVLYATGKSKNQPAVVAYQIKGSSLEEFSSQEIGDGGAACIAVNPSGTVLASAQYGGGSTATFSLDSKGRILPRTSLVEHGPGSKIHPTRQEKPHPHWVGFSFDGKFLLVPDLGRDRVIVYEAREDAKIYKTGEGVTPPGSGPRHMKLHPENGMAYVLNELSLTVSVMQFNAQTGELQPVQEIPSLPKSEMDSNLNTAGEIRIHPNRKFVYTSNRGHDSISVFRIDQKGELTFVQRESVRGSWPRNFAISPDGNWLVVGGRRSNTVALFAVNANTGRLTFTRKIINVPDPICFEFDK